jgi:dihydropteroate synthase
MSEAKYKRCFKAGDLTLSLGGRTLVMGIVNVTPDSFSDGGEVYNLQSAVNRAIQHETDGADILDIGGESTRPGSDPVPLEEELRRVIPVIEALQGRVRNPISIDSCKAEVARQALAAGARIVNDISSGSFDPAIVGVVAEFSAGVVLMHIKGTPRNMQQNPEYGDLVGEIKGFLTDAVSRFEAGGVSRDHILVDPGIGFGKNLSHNLELIRRLREFQGIAAGVLLGPSRKSFIGTLTGKPVEERLPGSIAAVVAGAMAGADIVRVHDVRPVVEALKVADAIRMAGAR